MNAELFYVVGRSGAGKDTILNQIRSLSGCTLAHRYITRPSDAGNENHIELSRNEFNVRKRLGAFLLDWEAHGLQYGIGVEVKHWLSAGLHVFVNGSRAYMQQAKDCLGDSLKTVLIDAHPETCAKRLLQRGRESRSDIASRLQRDTFETQTYDWVIDNNGAVPETMNSIMTKLNRYRLTNENSI